MRWVLLAMTLRITVGVLCSMVGGVPVVQRRGRYVVIQHAHIMMNGDWWYCCALSLNGE